MGYELHITRREDWGDDGDSIDLDEWLGVVERDPDLRLDGFADGTTPAGETLRVTSPGLAVWTAYSGCDTAWLGHGHGCIVVKNPDEEIITKMVQIAKLLGAYVQGDDGERYDGNERSTPTAAPGTRTRRRWWQR